MAEEPKHIGIILDGNRRFAKRLMKEPWKGHEWGAGKVEKLFSWARELGIRELTLYAFSMQNFNRPKREFDYLMKIFKDEFAKLEKDQRIDENRVRLRWIGRIHLLPQDIQEIIRRLEKKTESYDNYRINFAMAYGGQSEIVDAAKKIVKEVQEGTLNIDDIDEEKFSEYLYLKEGPDLIIRTGGARRTSNFLNYQSYYSEWLFLDKMWPEFEKEDLISAIEDFKERERRFGR